MNKNGAIALLAIILAVIIARGFDEYRQKNPWQNALSDGECAAKIGGEIFSARPDVDYRGCERYQSKP